VRLVLAASFFLSFPVFGASECVVLLHGLARVSNSMGELAEKLENAGYQAENINYPSRKHSIEVLAKETIAQGLERCGAATQIHFVTHSLGGILLRYYYETTPIANLGRVVMLGPPNHGSELVNMLLHVPGFKFFAGPTGAVLGTGEGHVPEALGAVDFDLGVIAGTLNVNPLSFFAITKPNDSIVSVESTKVEGMNEHLVLPVMHTIMMRDNRVIDNVIHYLKTGLFIPQV
jgi:pimeloyl-ACP methyl ester carboxylesterase